MTVNYDVCMQNLQPPVYREGIKYNLEEISKNKYENWIHKHCVEDSEGLP